MWNMFLRFSVFLLIVLIVKSEYRISIVHFNDFHARFEPITSISVACKQEPCIGGFSRLYTAIHQLYSNLPNPLLVNAGDNFQGSFWYTVYKWNVTQHFLNKLPMDAMTLGNHEFDDGIEGLIPFLKHIKTPVVVANINDTNVPQFHNLYHKSVILNKNNRKIGIIGVITTNIFSSVGNLSFLDESRSVNEEATKLVTHHNVFTNIIISHCGYEVDLEIAKQSTSKISIIVGGHTDTFLYTGHPTPGPDKSSGNYPTIVTNKDGNKVLVVQASAYTKYLGNLTVIYDDDEGKILDWSGNPIFLDSSFATDPNIDADLKRWKTLLDDESNKVVGQSFFTMLNSPCRVRECLLGNFVTDAMIFAYLDLENEFFWSDASIAIFHAGGMRTPLSQGNITFNDLSTTFPFGDSFDIFEIQGRNLQTIFENRVTDKRLKMPHLYQVSGIHIVFNISQPEGQRVQQLKVRCRKCRIPRYENLEPELYYRVILPTFLTTTNFDPLFKQFLINKKAGFSDLDVYMKYLKHRSPYYGEIEERIIITT